MHSSTLRLVVERKAALSAEVNPARLLGRIVDEKPADAEALITNLVSTVEFDGKDVHFGHAIAEAFANYPGAITAGLVARIAADLPLPYAAGDYLRDAPLLDTGPVAEVALNPSTPERRLIPVAAVIGTPTVSALFDQLIAVDGQLQALGHSDQQLSNAHGRLMSALAATRQNVFVSALIEKARTSDPRRIGLLADALARHGDKTGGERPPIDADHRADLRIVVERWIESLLTASQPVRYDSSRVARAAERLADPDLAGPLRRLLERDLIAYAAARAARVAAPARGPHDDVGYTLMYSRAFAAMHDAPAVEILTQGLGDLRWGIEAAGALLDIWSAAHPPIGGIFGRTNDLTRRSELAVAAPLSADFAEVIFAVVRVLGDASKSDAEQQHALSLALTGLALPHESKRREIDALLALPQPLARKQRLLSVAARTGEIIPAELLMEGLKDLLEAAKTQNWRLYESRGELMGWIDLFPFSDNPELVHDALALLPEQRRRPHFLGDLLKTIPQGPGAQALAMLERLAADDPAFLQQFEWLNALIKLDTEAGALAVLNHLCLGRLSAADAFRLSSALTGSARKHKTVREAIIARYRALPAGNNDIRQILERTMDDLTDEEVFWALFDNRVDEGRSLGGVVEGAIRNLAIGRKPSQEFDGAFEEIGLPLTRLRARLFAMLPMNDLRARLAEQCLIAIEEFRDEHGRVSSEPRHPDIASGRPWPLQADELGR